MAKGSGSRQLKTSLYAKRGETSRFVDAVVDKDGDLVVSGQDVGKAPREFWGDADYEFWLLVRGEHKGRVISALIAGRRSVRASAPSLVERLCGVGASAVKDRVLLALIKVRYVGHFSAVDEFRDFLKSRGIPYEFGTWA